MNAPAASAADSAGSHPASGQNVQWCSGRGCAYFDGTDAALTTDGPVLATGPGHSFTVSASVNLNHFPANNAFATAVSQDGSSQSGFFLQYSAQDHRWAFTMPTTPTGSDHRALGRSIPTPGVWTFLTGVYDASTGQAKIYVDGTPGGTATDHTPIVANGPLAIGRARFVGKSVDWFPGTIKNVEVFGQALTNAQVTLLAQNAAKVP